MKETEEFKIERGIGINGGFKEIVVSLFVVILMFVVPVLMIEKGEEIAEAINPNANSNPYSAEAVNQRNGKVAGISTEKGENIRTTNTVITIPIVEYEIDLSGIATDSIPLLISGVIFFSIAIFLTAYVLLGRFN